MLKCSVCAYAFFSSQCLLWTWPAGLPSFSFNPLNKQLRLVDFLRPMPHCVLTPFSQHLWGFKVQKRERKTTGNVKEIFQITSSPCWEDSAVTTHTFVTCIQSDFCSGDHCKHLYCDVLPALWVYVSPCSTTDSSLCWLLQLRSVTPEKPLVY